MHGIECNRYPKPEYDPKEIVKHECKYPYASRSARNMYNASELEKWNKHLLKHLQLISSEMQSNNFVAAQMRNTDDSTGELLKK